MKCPSYSPLGPKCVNAADGYYCDAALFFRVFVMGPRHIPHTLEAPFPGFPKLEAGTWQPSVQEAPKMRLQAALFVERDLVRSHPDVRPQIRIEVPYHGCVQSY